MAEEASKFEKLQTAGMGRGLSRWAESASRADSIAWLKPNERKDDEDGDDGTQTTSAAMTMAAKRDSSKTPAHLSASSSSSSPLGPALSAGLKSMQDLKMELIETWGCGARKRGVDASTTSPSTTSMPTTVTAAAGLGLLSGHALSHQLARYPGDGQGYHRHRDAFPPTPSTTTSTTTRSTSSSGGKEVGEALGASGAGSVLTAGNSSSGGAAASASASAGVPIVVSSSSSEPYRRLTAIYYLNPNWDQAAGGKLRLFIPQQQNNNSDDDKEPSSFFDVEPLLDRLVVFRADRVDHEVAVSCLCACCLID